MWRYGAVCSGSLQLQETPATAAPRPGGVADEANRSVDVAQPTDHPAPDQTLDTAPCPCGSDDHDPVRIGKTYSESGAPMAVYVCPAASPTGLRGAL